jgi:hypothetical protein
MSETLSRPLKIPSYRRHKQSGQAVVTLSDGLGKRRDVLLGPWLSKARRQEYARVIGEWEAAGRQLVEPIEAGGDISVSEVAAAFWRHVQSHYRGPNGRPTSEQWLFKAALKPLKAMYGKSN